MHKNMQNFAITYQISYFFPFILSKKDVLIRKNILYNSFTIPYNREFSAE